MLFSQPKNCTKYVARFKTLTIRAGHGRSPLIFAKTISPILKSDIMIVHDNIKTPVKKIFFSTQFVYVAVKNNQLSVIRT